MSGPYQRQDRSNCGTGRLLVAINCGILSVKLYYSIGYYLFISFMSLSQRGSMVVNQSVI